MQPQQQKLWPLNRTHRSSNKGSRANEGWFTNGRLVVETSASSRHLRVFCRPGGCGLAENNCCTHMGSLCMHAMYQVPVPCGCVEMLDVKLSCAANQCRQQLKRMWVVG
jgi:hypothetical protein